MSDEWVREQARDLLDRGLTVEEAAWVLDVPPRVVERLAAPGRSRRR